ncbi:hypothetical protein HYX05_03970 [Candidatus Woesearchaeota archaeon]|nr:hypothetical protein [Candidatus Woesearchaeota archaeon]
MPFKPTKIKDFRGPENLKNFLGKRGFFFILDAVLGLTVLVIGIFLITSSYVNAPQPQQVSLLSDDLMDFLSNKKIRELNNPYAGIGGQLWAQGVITDADNSLLQQIGEFYAKNNMDTAEKFIQNVSKGIVPEQFRYEVWIDGTILYPKTPSAEHIESKSSTTILLAAKKLTFGIVNKTTSDLWGPYKAEVFVWER